MSKYIMGHRAKTRSVIIKYTVIVGLLLIVLASMQASLLSRFRIFGAVCDLMICAVVCMAFLGGRHMGAIVGIAGGFLVEALGSTGVMLLPLFYMLLGYIVGHYARAMQKKYTSYLLYLGLTLLYRAVITLFYTCITYQSINLPQIILRILLPEAILTAIAGCVIYFPMLLLFWGLEKIR